MNSKSMWLRIAGTIFGLVSLLHLLRILTGIRILIGDCSLPVWINWFGLIAGGALSYLLWKISAGKPE